MEEKKFTITDAYNEMREAAKHESHISKTFSEQSTFFELCYYSRAFIYNECAEILLKTGEVKI